MVNLKLDNKGQALVEFVLILPLILFIVFVIVDFGVIFSAKNTLEGDSGDIVLMIENGEGLNKIYELYPNTSIEMNEQDNYIKVKMKRKVDIITPGLNLVMDNPYTVEVERVIMHD